MFKSSMRVLLLATPILALAAACSSSGGPSGAGDPITGGASGGTATLQVFVHDAPSDYIATADVTFTRVYLTPNGGGGDVEVMSTSDGPMTLDLMQLQNGIQAMLASRQVPARNYSQLRMVVDSATVTLIPGYTFEDGSTTQSLSIPSSMNTGIKVQLAGNLEPTEGMTTLLAVDFDVNQSFIMQGDPTNPSGIRGFTFIPVITETDRQEVAG
jgi:hypothetical protein